MCRYHCIREVKCSFDFPPKLKTIIVGIRKDSCSQDTRKKKNAPCQPKVVYLAANCANTRTTRVVPIVVNIYNCEETRGPAPLRSLRSKGGTIGALQAPITWAHPLQLTCTPQDELSPRCCALQVRRQSFTLCSYKKNFWGTREVTMQSPHYPIAFGWNGLVK